MRRWMVFIARALALLWGASWFFFFVAEPWGWGTPARVWTPWAGVGRMFVILALVSWRWKATGGLLLVVVGVLIGVANTIWPTPGLLVVGPAITTVLLSGPPLMAGILFLKHDRAGTAQA